MSLNIGEKVNGNEILEVVDKRKRKYRIRCSCGREYERIINSATQLSTHCRSCRPQATGPKPRSSTTRRTTTHSPSLSKTRLYRIWKKMKSRCNDPTSDLHNSGISYHYSWESFDNFKQWALANGYTDDLHLIRHSLMLDFCPQNCMWSATYQQNNSGIGSEYYGFDYDN